MPSRRRSSYTQSHKESISRKSLKIAIQRHYQNVYKASEYEEVWPTVWRTKTRLLILCGNARLQLVRKIIVWTSVHSNELKID